MDAKHIEIRLHQGYFDICRPNDRQWSLSLKCDLGNVRLFFDEKPDLPEWSGVEDVVNLMRKRMNVIIFGGKQESGKILDAIMDDVDAYELALARQQLVKAQTIAASTHDRVACLQSTISYLSKQVATTPTETR